MVGMVASLCVVLSCLPLALLGGCSSGSQAPKCIPGASAACACPTGQPGAQICNSAGTFGVCTCSSSTADAAPDLAISVGPQAQLDTRPASGHDEAGPEAAVPDLRPKAGPEAGSEVAPMPADAYQPTADAYTTPLTGCQYIQAPAPVQTVSSVCGQLILPNGAGALCYLGCTVDWNLVSLCQYSAGYCQTTLDYCEASIDNQAISGSSAPRTGICARTLGACQTVCH
jgi:hypothetical protein